MHSYKFISAVVVFYEFVHVCLTVMYPNFLIVQSGSDLNFVNLWNLKGYAFNDGNGNLRNAIIDRQYPDSCLSQYRMVFPNQWTIRLYKTENHSIYSWIQKVAFPYEYGDGKQMKINPNSNLVLHVFPEGQEDKIFCAVWYTTTGYSPKIYCAWTAVQASTVIAQLSNNQAPAGFLEMSYLVLLGVYDSACSPLLTPNDTIDTTVHAALKMMLCSATELEQATNGRVQEAFFIEAEGYDDHLPDSLLFLLASGTSLSACAAICRNEVRCLSYFYSKTSMECYAYERRISWTNSPKNNAGFKHYTNAYCNRL